MDWWLTCCEYCDKTYSKGWGHSCVDEGGEVMFRDGMGNLRSDFDPINGSAGMSEEEYETAQKVFSER